MTARRPSKAVETRLAKLLGKSAYWEINQTAPTADQRAEFSAKMPALRAAKDAARQRMEARRAELLKDPEYLRLKEESIAADKASQHAAGMSVFYPISVGTRDSLFFRVEAQGDSWDAVLEAVTAKKARA